jgi:hypothetical protein
MVAQQRQRVAATRLHCTAGALRSRAPHHAALSHEPASPPPAPSCTSPLPPPCCCSIARLLLFLSLVPESVPALPSNGSAAYLRKLWADPEHPGRAVEVQVIGGKTLERNLVGSWAEMSCPLRCCPCVEPAWAAGIRWGPSSRSPACCVVVCLCQPPVTALACSVCAASHAS